jgi:hypothetical protein
VKTVQRADLFAINEPIRNILRIEMFTISAYMFLHITPNINHFLHTFIYLFVKVFIIIGVC